jgi:hypothetical protein
MSNIIEFQKSKNISSIDPNGVYIGCPTCGDPSNWVIRVEGKGKKSQITTIICMSDDCEGETFFHVKNGII